MRLTIKLNQNQWTLTVIFSIYRLENIIKEWNPPWKRKEKYLK